MKNRILPLGYTVQDGEIVIHKAEAKTVIRIFTDYINGSSLKTLASVFNQEGVAFKENATAWNKGRLYHILTERRYLGDNGFPQIIAQELFDKANTLKNSKGAVKKELDAEIEYIKGIARCGKCGKPLIRNIKSDKTEEWLCVGGCRFWFRPTDKRLLQGVAAVAQRIMKNPELLNVRQEHTGYKKTPELMRLHNEMIRMNEQTLPSFPMGKKLILELANTKFVNCAEDKSVYTEYVLQRVMRVAESGNVDVAFLKEAVLQVKIIGKKEIAVVFKNGAEISEKEGANNECETCNEDRSQSATIQTHE